MVVTCASAVVLTWIPLAVLVGVDVCQYLERAGLIETERRNANCRSPQASDWRYLQRHQGRAIENAIFTYGLVAEVVAINVTLGTLPRTRTALLRPAGLATVHVKV